MDFCFFDAKARPRIVRSAALAADLATGVRLSGQAEVLLISVRAPLRRSEILSSPVHRATGSCYIYRQVRRSATWIQMRLTDLHRVRPSRNQT